MKNSFNIVLSHKGLSVDKTSKFSADIVGVLDRDGSVVVEKNRYGETKGTVSAVEFLKIIADMTGGCTKLAGI